MKNFNQTSWNQILASKNWESIGAMENVNEMAVQFSKLVNDALDEILFPYLIFLIQKSSVLKRSKYIHTYIHT